MPMNSTNKCLPSGTAASVILGDTDEFCSLSGWLSINTGLVYLSVFKKAKYGCEGMSAMSS